MRWIATFFSLVFVMPFYIFAQQEEIDAPVSKVFVPNGFDDTDQVEVFIHGEFAKGCHELSSVTVNNHEKFIFYINVKAKLSTDEMCDQSLHPYLSAVNLGKLEQGVYEIIVNPGEHEVRRSISIGKSLSGVPDDSHFADVTYATIEREDAEHQLLIVEGSYPFLKRGCARFEDPPIVVDGNEDVITVLPILSYFEGARCTDGNSRFRLKMRMERELPNKTLVHVRRVGGLSYAKLIFN